MLKKQDQADICELCGAKRRLTFHHLIPRKMHRRTFFKKHYTKVELQEGILVCRPCHSGIHKLYDEMTLAKHFNCLSKLKSDPAVCKHIEWAAKLKIRD